MPEKRGPIPRAVLFRMLTLLWLFPSAGALWLLLADTAWLRAGNALEHLHAVRVEQWVAVGLLLLHAWFAWRWRRAARAA